MNIECSKQSYLHKLHMAPRYKAARVRSTRLASFAYFLQANSGEQIELEYYARIEKIRALIVKEIEKELRKVNSQESFLMQALIVSTGMVFALCLLSIHIN